MAKKKTVTINTRILLRQYRIFRDKLIYGEVDRVIIPVNGKKLFMAVLPDKKHRTGDIRPLLEKLKKTGPIARIRRINWEWDSKNFDLMKKLWKK